MSQDPIGFEGDDWNLYRYVANDPIDGIDPSGLWDQAVHEQKTKQWASEVYIDLGFTYITFRDKDSKRIGEGSGGMDIWYNSAANPAVLNRHFNTNRGSSKKDTRIQYFESQRQTALRQVFPPVKRRRGVIIKPAPITERCHEAMWEFGKGLHAIQDMDSHMDLTPAEHMTRSNRRYVDDPNYVRGKELNPKAERAPGGEPARRSVGLESYLYQHDIKFWENYIAIVGAHVGAVVWVAFENKPVRVWHWGRSLGQPRLRQSEIRTKTRLCEFLSHLVNTSCVKKSVKKPGKFLCPYRGGLPRRRR